MLQATLRPKAATVSKTKKKNKSTTSGAKYARSSVIFPHRMAFVMGEADAVKRGPKLNMIKKFGERGGGGGGGGNPTTLTVSSLVSEF